ncbi:MAG: C25 family cysteine peptidase [bacterium]|nr:C25 family cysteine peptidase [bacterium]
MRILTVSKIGIVAALGFISAQASESKLTASIPQALVTSRVAGVSQQYSDVQLDFRQFWNSQAQTYGNEQYSTWIRLPDTGNPICHAEGILQSGSSIDLHDCVKIGNASILRGVRIAPIFIKPSIFIDGAWQKITGVTITISASGKGQNEVLSNHRSKAFDSIYSSLLLNPDKGTDEFDVEHLLIIAPDFAAGNLASFVEWKRRKGVECTLATLGEIGISPTDDQGLKNYLQQAYDTWANPPDFVLLAGDETVLPVHHDYTEDPSTMFNPPQSSFPGAFLDENYFACLEGNDNFPDVVLGRWVVNTAYEYFYLAAKLTRYEMQPNLLQTEWYKHAQVGADDSEESQRTTKLFTRELMLNYGFTQVDTLFRPDQPYQFVQWINEGRSIVNYRGSGWSMGWAGINMYIPDLYNIQNSFKLPIVTGIGCGVGRFGEPDGQCFGEVWMLLGSLSDQRGAISFIGPGHNTHTMFNDSLDIGIYNSMFVDGEARIGTALVAGKMFMYDAFDDYIPYDQNIEEILRVAFNQYYLLSDPELKPYTDVPAQFQVEHQFTVQLGVQLVPVTVRDAGGNPVSGAQVAMYLHDSFMAVDETNLNGMVTLTSNASYLPSYAYLTVTKKNYAPKLDSIMVISASQYVAHLSDVIYDSTGGNGDGGLSPGESLDWFETLKNFGIALAPSVQAQLTSSHPEVAITQPQAAFGNIPAGDSSIGAPPFQLNLAASPYSIGDSISFQVNITDAMDSSWVSYLLLPLKTPNLQVSSLSPDPEGNGRLDRGETCTITWIIENVGILPVTHGVFELHSDDPLVTIINGAIPCDTLYSNMQISSGDTPFVVSISPYTPTLHPIQFQVKLVSQELTYQFADSEQFSFTVGQWSAGDPTVDTTGTYYGYESSDVLYSEAPVFEWLEIDPQNGGSGTVLPFRPDLQDTAIQLPFSFQYWGQSSNIITISADGWVKMGITNVISPQYHNLPFADGVMGMIAGLWGNWWNQFNETGRISYYYAQDQGRFYIEWYQVSLYTSTTVKETFQIVLCDPAVNPTITGDGEIIFNYRDLDNFGMIFPTSGIESPDELYGVVTHLNQTPIVTSHGLSDSLSVKWTTDPPLISAVPPSQPGFSAIIPKTIAFNAAYPNPFNATTSLVFGIPTSYFVQLDVFNLQGQLVANLHRGKLNAGYHRFEFNGNNLGSGIYFARLLAHGQISTQKLLLLK